MIVWEPDPLKQDHGGPIFWAPDSQRFIFFADHGWVEKETIRSAYYVVVSVRNGLENAQFQRVAIPAELYVKAGAPATSETILFHPEAVQWLGENTIEVRSPKENIWVEETITLTLPPEPERK